MKFLSVCSGIEAASVAWHDLGFECVGVSEIDKFPSEVLKHHYPSVPNLGDMTKYKEWKDDLAPELLVGGTPCQSFSVAGLRKGMDDPRGNLALTYVGIAEKYKPKWFIWENVPGVLSSNGGKDFSSFLSAMADIGYGIAYRVLDAQFFGVPQRRRRVFVVGYLGDWRPAVSVLFEPSSVFGHTPKGRKKGKGTAAPTETSPRTDDEGLNADKVGALLARDYKDINTDGLLQGKAIIEAQFWNGSQTAEALTATSNNQRMADKGRMQMVVEPNNSVGIDIYNVSLTGNISCTVTARSGENASSGPKVLQPIVLMDQGGSFMSINDSGLVGILRAQVAGHPPIVTENTHATLTTTHGPRQGSSDEGVSSVKAIFSNTMRVRRLTPVECERLQGFPDNWTQIPYGKKPKEQCPEGHRYKALGNSMAVPVMRWIGRRIKLFNEVNDAIQSAKVGKTND